MKKQLFFIGLILLFTACVNEQKKQEGIELEKESHMTVDSLPEGTWNGEYIKIDSDEYNKRKVKSLGSNIYSMGTVKMDFGTDSINFKLFDKKKTALTFTNTRISAFIRSAHGEGFQIRFKKDKIINNYKGTYKAAEKAEQNNTVSMQLETLVADELTTFKFSEGTVEITDFNPRLANLSLKFSGTFKDENGNTKSGKGEIELRFEEAIMTID